MTHKKILHFTMLFILTIAIALDGAAQKDSPGLRLEGKSGPGKGKHIVFVSGDEAYRSEEALPLLAKILSEHHGFTCTVLFPIDKASGTINPNVLDNIPGLEVLREADLMVIFTRFRELPDEQMKYIDEYTKAGKPVVALRTSTHAFRYVKNPTSPYAKYSFDSKAKGWEQGYGKQVLGENWVSHHGKTGEGTRAVVNALVAKHAILRGVKDIWTTTDVYGIRDIQGDETVLLYGLVTLGLDPSAPGDYGRGSMPIAWVKDYTSEAGNTGRVFATTLGASIDLKSEDLRRLLVNGCYWALGMDAVIPEKSNVTLDNKFSPTMWGMDGFKKNVKPSDLR
ncbi:MAG TPA: ThuA domain-containing protein [Chryseosolibacter sp.]|nr:ThuA domain-containing protein [Chryseosolibacter sp.]